IEINLFILSHSLQHGSIKLSASAQLIFKFFIHFVNAVASFLKACGQSFSYRLRWLYIGNCFYRRNITWRLPLLRSSTCHLLLYRLFNFEVRQFGGLFACRIRNQFFIISLASQLIRKSFVSLFDKREQSTSLFGSK